VVCTLLATPAISLVTTGGSTSAFTPNGERSPFDAFGHAELVDLEWRRPDPAVRAFDKSTPIHGDNPERMVFVMRRECTFLPRELACLHATGMGLTDEWALAPYGIDDATDAFYEQRLAPREWLWLAADNLNALVWGLHDWSHFHNHGPFEERALTELHCDVSALVWLSLNRDAIGLDENDLRRIARELCDVSRGRFEHEKKPFDESVFELEEIERRACGAP
jgi:hypothetical protein